MQRPRMGLLYHRGYELFNNRNYIEAEKLFLKCFAIKKPHEGLLSVLAKTEYKLGKHKEAIAVRKKLIELLGELEGNTAIEEKEMIKSYRNLIDNMIYKKEFEKAKIMHEEMKRNCPRFVSKRDNEKLRNCHF